MVYTLQFNWITAGQGIVSTSDVEWCLLNRTVLRCRWGGREVVREGGWGSVRGEGGRREGGGGRREEERVAMRSRKEGEGGEGEGRGGGVRGGGGSFEMEENTSDISHLF